MRSIKIRVGDKVEVKDFDGNFTCANRMTFEGFRGVVERVEVDRVWVKLTEMGEGRKFERSNPFPDEFTKEDLSILRE